MPAPATQRDRVRITVRARARAHKRTRIASQRVVTLEVRGRLTGLQQSADRRVRIDIRVAGRWRSVGRAMAKQGGRFELTLKVRVPAKGSQVRASLGRSGDTSAIVAR
jgi:hypothetical protein